MNKLLRKMVLTLTVIALGFAVSPQTSAFAEEDLSAGLTVGQKYTLDGMGGSAIGNKAIYLGHNGNSAFFQSTTGLYKGDWPGQDALPVTEEYWGDYCKYNAVSNVYLPRNESGETISKNKPFDCTYFDGSEWVRDGNALAGLREAAQVNTKSPKTAYNEGYTWLGTRREDWWLGTVNVDDYAYTVTNSDSDWTNAIFSYRGITDCSRFTFSTIIAPSFTVDLSKVNVNGNTITVKNTGGTDTATALSGERMIFVIGIPVLVVLAIVICVVVIYRKRKRG